MQGIISLGWHRKRQKEKTEIDLVKEEKYIYTDDDNLLIIYIIKTR